VGRWYARRMMEWNRTLCELVRERLAPPPGGRFLDAGFGPGNLIALVLRDLGPDGFVGGVDLSADMVRMAGRLNAAAVREGRLDLRRGDVARLPWPDGSFDRASAVNTIYFWPDPLAGLGELRRVLKPGGLAGIALRPRHQMKDFPPARTEVFTLYEPEEVAGLLARAGFAAPAIHARPRSGESDDVVVVARR